MVRVRALAKLFSSPLQAGGGYWVIHIGHTKYHTED